MYLGTSWGRKPPDDIINCKWAMRPSRSLIDPIPTGYRRVAELWSFLTVQKESSECVNCQLRNARRSFDDSIPNAWGTGQNVIGIEAHGDDLSLHEGCILSLC